MSKLNAKPSENSQKEKAAEEVDVGKLKQELAKLKNTTDKSIDEFFISQSNFHSAMKKLGEKINGGTPTSGQTSTNSYLNDLRKSTFAMIPLEDAIKLNNFLDPYRKLSSNPFSALTLDGKSTQQRIDMLKGIMAIDSPIGSVPTKRFDNTLSALNVASSNYTDFRLFLSNLANSNEIKKNPDLVNFVNDLMQMQAIKPIQHGPRYELLLKASIENLLKQKVLCEKLLPHAKSLEEKEELTLQIKNIDKMVRELRTTANMVQQEVKGFSNDRKFGAEDEPLSANLIIVNLAGKLTAELDKLNNQINDKKLNKSEEWREKTRDRSDAIHKMLADINDACKSPNEEDKAKKVHNIIQQYKNNKSIKEVRGVTSIFGRKSGISDVLRAVENQLTALQTPAINVNKRASKSE